ncbi:MAG: CDP-alcohol phosphatidyltransferase family protein [Pseudomonadota bacterium]|nr:CDP-alcohol phosphatidyltransferase family protein [Pseudomonadota bacterium]
MLDAALRRRIDPPIEALAGWLAGRGATPNLVTVAGLGLGLAAAGSIALGAPLVGLVLILVSRLCDGLDGAIARQSRPSDLGGFLDIVFDFIFYGAIPLGFALLDPAQNGLAAAFLLFTFYANGASVLAFAIMAEKRGIAETSGRGGKSLMFTVGLAEASETLAAFVLACLFPEWFVWIAVVFGAMTAYTCLARIVLAQRLIGEG